MPIRVQRGKGTEVGLALQWTGDNLEEMRAFATDGFRYAGGPLAYVWDRVGAQTWEPLRINDWVVQGLFGEFYPCAQEDFDATWHRVDE